MWGPCYEGISLRDRWTQAYYIFYILRRFIFISIGLFVEHPVFQFMGLMALNYSMVMYTASNRPLTSRFDNRLEILNEYLLNICCMHLIFFNDGIPIETQQGYGWSMVVFVAALCTVNMLVVFYELAAYLKLLLLRQLIKLTQTKAVET